MRNASGCKGGLVGGACWVACLGLQTSNQSELTRYEDLGCTLSISPLQSLSVCLICVSYVVSGVGMRWL